MTRALPIPTMGSGEGLHPDAQLLVSTGRAAPGKPARFVKQYADLCSVLTRRGAA